MNERLKINYEWREDLTKDEWDNLLSRLNGHPLQSAKWGDARKQSCQINYHRWVALKNGEPVFLVRFEERLFFNFFKIAWVPKGPISFEENNSLIQKQFFKKLKKKGFFICATNPWNEIKLVKKPSLLFYTVWIDLQIGKEKLWMNLKKQCRNDIKRSKKLGVIIEESNSLADLNSFYKICESISKSKKFSFGNSFKIMSYLLSNVNNNDAVKSYLFISRYENEICGGAFIMACGESIHYISGAVDRRFSHLCIGEALQWVIIEWALNNNYKKYDLEGISSKQDSGVDKFKKKFGGYVVAYPGIQFYPLRLDCHIVSFLGPTLRYLSE
ncbi:MAG TPA: peptidoglycan bridge formation glycyltransferase FemA/FemB family protein [Gammaproteobacteria bacterium]|nr:peptidoglycan bridge formation glycyltransferase FemA/FemB family protein [Gammaproteobacteria bacterium]